MRESGTEDQKVREAEGQKVSYQLSAISPQLSAISYLRREAF